MDAHPAWRAPRTPGIRDWEDCLGAASQSATARLPSIDREGGGPTIFSAAMMGQLDAVKGLVAASPGVQQIPGPHSISLLAHAKAGGSAAAAVHEYLDGLGDAGAPKTNQSPTQKAALVGSYVFGRGASDRIEVTLDKGALMFLAGRHAVRARVDSPRRSDVPIRPAPPLSGLCSS